MGIISCSQQKDPGSTAELPTDIRGLQNLLKDKQAEQANLNDKIDQIRARLTELDPSLSEEKTPVTVLPIELGAFHHFVEFQGTVTSDDDLLLSSEIGGRITELYAEEGNYVKAGQRIARLDLETFEIQIQETETALELASTIFQKQARLWEQNIGSEIQYLEAKNNKERLEKNLASQQAQLRKGNVYAPISGVIDQVLLRKGEMAAPGAPIVSLLNTNRVKVKADVPESYLSAVRRGQVVDIDFPAIGHRMSAKISLLGRRIHPTNRTFEVEIDVPNSGGRIKPNLLASLRLQDYKLEDVVSIPSQLIQEEVSGRKYVLVATMDDQGNYISAKKTVQTGEYSQDMVHVESGLVEGDILILEGALGLAEEKILTVLEDSTIILTNEQ